jgi:hypothetical protein
MFEFLQLNSCHGHLVFSVALGCSYPFLFMLFHLKSFVLVQYMACNNWIICQQGATIVDRAVIITHFTFYGMILILIYIKQSI